MTILLVHLLVMRRVNVHEAKTHLSEHLDRLERGEEDVVVICRRNAPIAELRAIPRRRTEPRPHLVRDPRFALSPAFFDPLPEEVLAGFEGGAR
jgi:antitoxin (DNA-binding transcriptional repressor) of toxin-antitoxin stability system